VNRSRRILVAGALGALVFGVACSGDDSNGSSFKCCFNLNGQKSFWTCPDQAAYNQCCVGGLNAGCVNDNPGTCTPDPKPPSDCST
jgi:hypothetical protein